MQINTNYNSLFTHDREWIENKNWFYFKKENNYLRHGFQISLPWGGGGVRWAGEYNGN